MGYSWGDDTSVSNSGGSGGGFNWTSAKRAYSGGRSYRPASTKSNSSARSYGSSRVTSRGYNINAPLAKDKVIKTNSPTPLVVAIDVTGSMHTWPEVFFEKLPLLYAETQRYFPDVEISFAAVGDAHSDQYPLQIGNFAKGKDLDAIINSLYPEGNGGGQAKETYELAAYYYLNNCKMPKAKNPMFIYLGDEGFYENLAQGIIREHIGGSPEKDQDGRQLIQNLAQRFSTYILRKSYTYGHEENEINNQWKSVLGPEKVNMLDDPRRVVDCIIGLVAGEAGKFDDYYNRLSQRQTVQQVKQVMTSIKNTAALPGRNQGVSLRKLPPGSTSQKLC